MYFPLSAGDFSGFYDSWRSPCVVAAATPDQRRLLEEGSTTGSEEKYFR